MSQKSNDDEINSNKQEKKKKQTDNVKQSSKHVLPGSVNSLPTTANSSTSSNLAEQTSITIVSKPTTAEPQASTTSPTRLSVSSASSTLSRSFAVTNNLPNESVSDEALKSNSSATCLASSSSQSHINPEAILHKIDDTENQCYICLHAKNHPCYADGCLHQFCANCLMEWSKRSNQCPVCRTLFRNVIINVKSDVEYDTIPVHMPARGRYRPALEMLLELIGNQIGNRQNTRLPSNEESMNGPGSNDSSSNNQLQELGSQENPVSLNSRSPSPAEGGLGPSNSNRSDSVIARQVFEGVREMHNRYEGDMTPQSDIESIVQWRRASGRRRRRPRIRLSDDDESNQTEPSRPRLGARTDLGAGFNQSRDSRTPSPSLEDVSIVTGREDDIESAADEERARRSPILRERRGSFSSRGELSDLSNARSDESHGFTLSDNFENTNTLDDGTNMSNSERSTRPINEVSPGTAINPPDEATNTNFEDRSSRKFSESKSSSLRKSNSSRKDKSKKS